MKNPASVVGRVSSLALLLLSVCAGIAHAGTATLHWTPPELNTDGTTLDDLAGYRIYSGCQASGQYERDPIEIAAPLITARVIDDLPAGSCWFTMTALNDAGTESAYSNEVTKLIDVVLPDPPGTTRIAIDWRESPEQGQMTEFSSATTGGGASSESSITATHEASGANRFVIVEVAYFLPATVNSVTYGGVAMTEIFSAVHDGANRKNLGIWVLVNPPTGSQSVIATLSAASFDRMMIVSSFTGVDQTTPNGTHDATSGSSAAPSITINSSVGALVYDALYTWSGAQAGATAGAGQTERAETIVGGNGASAAISTEPGAASVTMSWTLSASGNWALFAVPILPAAAGTETVAGDIDAPVGELSAEIDAENDVAGDFDAPVADFAATIDADVDVSADFEAPVGQVAATVDPGVELSVAIDAPVAGFDATVDPQAETSVAIDAPIAGFAATVAADVELSVDLTAPMPTIAATVTAGQEVSVDLLAPVASFVAACLAQVDVSGDFAAPIGSVTAGIAADGELSVAFTAPLAEFSADLDDSAILSVAMVAPIGELDGEVSSDNTVSMAIDAPLGELLAAISVDIDLSIEITAPTGQFSATISDGVFRFVTASGVVTVPLVDAATGTVAMISAGINTRPS